MISVVLRRFKSLSWVFVVLACGACTTTLGTSLTTGDDNSANGNETSNTTTPRANVVVAAERMQDAGWNMPSPVSLPDRLSSMILGTNPTFSGSDPVADYLANLRTNKPSLDINTLSAQVMNDAYANIDAAHVLADAITISMDRDLTIRAPHPSEIQLAERAIQHLRIKRTLYVGALKELTKSGASIHPEEIRLVKEAFFDAGRDLGRLADSMADRIARARDDRTPSSSSTYFSDLAADR